MTRRLGPSGSAARSATDLIHSLAVEQRGVVSRRQLYERGLRPGLIDGRIANGRLIPVFPAVYALGIGALDRQGRWMASVLAAGSSAALSHRSAAALHGLTRPGSGSIEVISPGSVRREFRSKSNPGSRRFSVIAHCTRSLPRDDVTRVEGIPVTSVPRTLLDLASVVDLKRVRAALIEAERLRVLSDPDLRNIIARGKGWRGTRRLRQAVAEMDPAEVETYSELEVEFLRLCRAGGLPPPSVNVAVEGFMVDFFWPETNLIVEVDGFAAHRRKVMFVGDRRRDVDLRLAGYEVARFTYEDLTLETEATMRKLRGLIAMLA